MAAFDPPWRLDPLMNIVNVGWGSSILVLYFEWQFVERNAEAVPTYTAAFTAGSDDATISGVPFSKSFDPVVNPPGPPEPEVSAQRFWSYPSQFNVTTTVVDSSFHVTHRGKYGVICSGGVITAFTNSLGHDTVPFIMDDELSGLFEEGGFDVYGIFESPSVENAMFQTMESAATLTFGLGVLGTARLFLLEEIRGEDVTQIITRYQLDGKAWTFLNIAKVASQSQAVRDAGKIKYVLNMPGQPELDSTRFTIKWSARMGVYKQRKFIFAPSEEMGITSDQGDIETQFRREDSVNVDEGRQREVEVTFTIDLATYEITSTRRNI